MDLWRGKLSLRQVRVFITYLSAESALGRVLDPEASAWNLTNHLLAALFESVQAGNWQRAGNEKIPRPARIPRPGVLDEAKAAASHTERSALALLKRQREREADS